MNPWRPCDEFYLRLILSAGSVLDVGCGTGTLLKRARQAGYTGRLRGIDPDPAMLGQARAWAGGDIEWVLADAASAAADGEFDLAVMTGHAFQELIGDEDVRASLAAVRAGLVSGGRFAFETRHLNARAWERWDGSSFGVEHPDGGTATVSYQVHEVIGDVVRLSETLSGPWWDGGSRSDQGELRFLALPALEAFLTEAGFVVERQYGDWDSGPLTDASEEIITIARRC